MSNNPRNTLKISSVQNPKVKHALQLRERRNRDKYQETLIEGFRELQKAVINGFYPKIIFYCPPFFLGTNESKLLKESQGKGTQLLETSEKVFSRLSYRDRPDGILGVSERIGVPLSKIKLKGENPLILIAEGIEKPGNLGAMVRSADGVGIDGVIVCDPKTEINNPNVIRASVGTIFTIPISEADTTETLTFLANNQFEIIVASPKSSTSFWDVDLCLPTAIVVGSEQYGLSEKWLRAGTKVQIPMRGKADSLNVSAAATLLLYEALRQRRN